MKLLLKDYVRILAGCGAENPMKELRLLLASACNKSYQEIFFKDISKENCFELKNDDFLKFKEFVKRRCLHEPITKILEKASFWNFEFFTNKFTLDPRTESELIIESVLQYYPDKTAKLFFLDLGIGTGCLLLSCLSEYLQSEGVGVDNSKNALLVSRKNAEMLGVERRCFLIESDWFSNIDNFIDNKKFDIVLCNPPYVSTVETLDREVLFDPPGALFAGKDGLEAYRKIFNNLKKYLKVDARVFLEIGLKQENLVENIIVSQGFRKLKTVKDFNEISRIMILEINK